MRVGVMSTSCVVLAVATLAAVTVSGDHLFHQHYARARAFRCRTPRATAVLVSALLPSSISGKLYTPLATVLHRCDSSSGCCLHSARAYCMAEQEDIISLPFQVTYVIDIGPVVKGTVLIEQVEAVNHTRCACVHSEGPR